MSSENAMVEGAADQYERNGAIDEDEIHNACIDSGHPDSWAFEEAMADKPELFRKMYEALQDTQLGKDVLELVKGCL